MNYKILVVGNDDESLSGIKEYLEKINYKVDISNSIEKAIYRIKNIKYSLILLKIELSDFHCFEVLRYLNKNKIFTPVIILSESSDLKTKLQAFRFGAVDYMVKPIDLDELEARTSVKL